MVRIPIKIVVLGILAFLQRGCEPSVSSKRCEPADEKTAWFASFLRFLEWITIDITGFYKGPRISWESVRFASVRSRVRSSSSPPQHLTYEPLDCKSSYVKRNAPPDKPRNCMISWFFHNFLEFLMRCEPLACKPLLHNFWICSPPGLHLK